MRAYDSAADRPFVEAAARVSIPQALRLVCEASPDSYDVCLVEKLFDDNSGLLESVFAERRALVVTTPSVDRRFGQKARDVLASRQFDARVMVLECDEQSKNTGKVFEICEAAIGLGLGRRDVLVSLSGGVCSDLVTMAASLIRRGIGHVRIPTTLIGQVDAGIGVKGGVNFSARKNYLGCYHPPEQVLIDPAFLETLPSAELSNGFAEIIKMAIISDQKLFDLIWEFGEDLLASGFARPHDMSRSIIWRACKLMLSELLPNLYEDQTYERLVDFGHTFSPRLEALVGYRMSHGQAVAVDMALSTAIACEMQLISEDDLAAVLQILTRLELPVAHRELTIGACLEAVQEAANHRGGRPNLVVPSAIGSGTFVRDVEQLPASLIRAAMDRIRNLVEAV